MSNETDRRFAASPVERLWEREQPERRPLKERLAVALKHWGTMCSSGIEVQLLLDGEIISIDRLEMETDP